jgi:predicted RNA-binding Zn-ribbon protein involved in translation (DUF1610 family)
VAAGVTQESVLAGRRNGERICPKCGAAFVCGSAAGAASCWCAELPPALALPDAASGCYCPACLREIIARQGQGRGPVAGTNG